MDSSQEIIEGRVAGIDSKLLYHWGKPEDNGEKMSEPHVCSEESLFCLINRKQFVFPAFLLLKAKESYVINSISSRAGYIIASTALK